MPVFPPRRGTDLPTVEVYGPSDADEAQPLNDFLADALGVDDEAEEIPALTGVKRGKATARRRCREDFRQFSHKKVSLSDYFLVT